MPKKFAALEERIFEVMRSTNLPGLSMAVVEDSEITYRRAFGYRDLDRGLPATPATLYGVGSLTKSFTCLAIMQLQERGLLNVDDPLDRYVDLSLKPHGETIRLWHLMTHTGGLPALGYAEAVIRKHVGASATGVPIASADDLLVFMRGAEDWVHCRPGERWFYLNEGYVLLGNVVERVSGQSYCEYVREHILSPLGMHRSFFTRGEVEKDPDAAVPYVLDREGRCIASSYMYGKISSDGGLISNAEDMARYVAMFLGGGEWDGVRLVTEGSLREMMRPRVATPSRPCPAFDPRPADQPASYYGYGLGIIPDFCGETLVGHSGSVLVATAYMGFVPARRIGVVLLANGAGYPLSQLGQYALAMLLGEDPEELPFRRAERILADLEGVYETFRGTFQVTVRRKGGLLQIEVRDKYVDQVLPLVPEEANDHRALFYVYAAGLRTPVEFYRTHRGVEMIYERYKMRRVSRAVS